MRAGLEQASRSLRIASIRLAPVGGDLAREVGNARARWDRRRSWLVAIADRAGLVGLGEAAPLPGVSPDSWEEAAAALDAAKARAQARALELGDAPIAAIDSFVTSLLAGHASPTARFALETALLDLHAQALGRPAHTLLGEGGITAGLSGSPREVEVSALLGDPHARGVLARARSLIADGARTLKLKVGAHPIEDDASALGALRAALGPGLVLFADANGAWTPDEARAALRAFAPHAIAFVEQPVAPAMLAGLGPCAIDVWADESLADATTRREALDAQHVAGLACKPTVVGGLAASLDLARAAAARNKAFAITHALEGPVALASCAVLACALGELAPRAGLWPHEALDVYTRVEPPLEGGRLRIASHPGLGFSPEERARLLEAPWRT